VALELFERSRHDPKAHPCCADGLDTDSAPPAGRYVHQLPARRGQDTGPEHGPIRTADHTSDETTLIVGTFTYTGTGWKTTGDALLANTAADQARKRRQAGHDELADEYSRSATGRQTA
jgi:hypothetical protein